MVLAIRQQPDLSFRERAVAALSDAALEKRSGDEALDRYKHWGDLVAEMPKVQVGMNHYFAAIAKYNDAASLAIDGELPALQLYSVLRSASLNVVVAGFSRRISNKELALYALVSALRDYGISLSLLRRSSRPHPRIESAIDAAEETMEKIKKSSWSAETNVAKEDVLESVDKCLRNINIGKRG
jgi:hypothetical protein